jgi:predicted AlkP superfamily pyrophosphatase or phosphodiesterase
VSPITLSTTRHWLSRILVPIAAGVALTFSAAAAARGPRLIVVLVVDQFRGDYVQKFGSQWTGGFRRLLTEAAYFSRTDYPYFNTVTCSGHSTISTGSYPSVHGMILNTWWDRAIKKEVACADAEGWQIVSYGAALKGAGESAERLRTSTLADELRAQLDPKTRILGFSLKARTAVTLIGQRADAAVWFDDRGAWITSTAYTDKPVPAVAAYVKQHPVEADFGKTWDRALPVDRYLFETPAIGAMPRSSMTAAFPHAVHGPGEEPDATFYAQWQSSPFSDVYLAGMALETARSLGAGQSDRTDYLAIGFSALDKIGHDFGPNSHEVQDTLISLDRTLDRFFTGLDQLVGKGNYIVAVTADHGVAPIPERSRLMGLNAGRVSPALLESIIEETLAPPAPARATPSGARPKHTPIVERMVNTDVYLTPGTWPTLRQQPAVLAKLRARLLDAPGVQAVYTRDELSANQFNDDAIGRSLARGHYSERSGDITIVLKPYWMLQSGGTTHGSAYGYDTRVPLFLMGAGIAPGEYRQAASPADIAPTLAFLAGVTLPRAQGRVLVEALR